MKKLRLPETKPSAVFIYVLFSLFNFPAFVNNKSKKCLYDVLEDGKVRPNQLFALATTYPVLDLTSEDIMMDKLNRTQTIKIKVYDKFIDNPTEEEIENVKNNIIVYIDSEEKLKRITQMLKESINNLDSDLKIIVILYYYEDMSIKDISESLNIPQGTIKSRLSRARKRLKEILSINEEVL